MARPRVIRSGSYRTGGPSLVSAWTQATNLVGGVLGRGPMCWLGWYDLRPWQETPTGIGIGDYKRNVTALESGGGRVRFSPVFMGADDSGEAVNPIALPTGGTYQNVQLGSRSQLGPLTWQPEDDVIRTRTVQAVSLLVVGLDSPPTTGDWATDVDPTWGQMDAASTPAQVRNIFDNQISMGPEVLSDLAHSPAVTYDLESLGGGTRFVGVWVVGYWIGPDITAAQVGNHLSWVVEDCAGPPRHGPTTYAWPIRRVANVPAGISDADPTRTVAQWSMQRFGHNAYQTGSSGGVAGVAGCSVIVVNGGTQCNARVDYHVGVAVDKTASPGAIMAVVPAATATVPGMLRLAPSVTGVPADVNAPYSYGSLVLVTGSGVSPPGATDTVAMALVTVG